MEEMREKIEELEGWKMKLKEKKIWFEDGEN